MNTQSHGEMTLDDGKTAGIFPYLVSRAAFFDRVVVNVWGVRRKRPGELVAGEGNLAIGGPGSFYARCIRRRHLVSGNDLQLKYGVMRPYKNLSPFVLTLWAGRSPVTCADLLLVLDSLMRRGYRAVISSVELTFDTEGTPLGRFARDLCSRARVSRVDDGKGAVTLYVGGARSPWQLRIYQKTRSIVRVEFVLRGAFLRGQGIRKPQDLLLLKKASLWRRVRFCTVDHSECHALPVRVLQRWLKRGWLLAKMPTRIFVRELQRARVNPRRWLIRSGREALGRRMQKNLIW